MINRDELLQNAIDLAKHRAEQLLNARKQRENIDDQLKRLHWLVSELDRKQKRLLDFETKLLASQDQTLAAVVEIQQLVEEGTERGYLERGE